MAKRVRQRAVSLVAAAPGISRRPSRMNSWGWSRQDLQLPSSAEPGQGWRPREPPKDAAAPFNTLISGSPSSLGAGLAVAIGRKRSRVHVRNATEDLRLNDVRDGVLVLYEIDALSSEGQESLHRWLESTGSRVRVISLAASSLYDLVGQRRFRADLYYRLCVIHIPAA